MMRLALIECERLAEHLPRSAPPRLASYSALLQSALDHVASAARLPSVALSSFDAKAFHYPADAAQGFDGVLISGSLSSIYDQEPWIQRLLQEIRLLDQHQVKMCGISFGHQAIVAALGGRVDRNPKGPEVSVRSANLTDSARQLFSCSSGMQSFKLHYHHNDAVLDLPPGFQVLASNNVTAYQALYKHPHLLTFCGHPDYSHTPKVLELLLEYDRQHRLVAEQLIEHGLSTLHEATDYEWVVTRILRFFSHGFSQC